MKAFIGLKKLHTLTENTPLGYVKTFDNVKEVYEFVVEITKILPQNEKHLWTISVEILED